MEEHILTSPPEYKLYKDTAIRLAAFFGGTIVAGYLIAENFKNLGQHSLVRKTWMICIPATIFVFAIAFLLPAAASTPYIIPFVYSWGSYFIVHHYQGDAIDQHRKDGGEFYSSGRVTLITIIGLVVTVAILFAIVLLLEKKGIRY